MPLISFNPQVFEICYNPHKISMYFQQLSVGTEIKNGKVTCKLKNMF